MIFSKMPRGFYMKSLNLELNIYMPSDGETGKFEISLIILNLVCILIPES